MAYKTLSTILREYLSSFDTDTSGYTRKQKLIEKLYTMAMSGNETAIKLILAYSDGMPKQQIESVNLTGVITYRPIKASESNILQSATIGKHTPNNEANISPDTL